MRYTGPVQFKLKGDGARNYISQARTFLGKMLETFSDSPDGQNWKTTLPDGTQFSAYLPAKGMIPIVNIVSGGIVSEISKYSEDIIYLLYVRYWYNPDNLNENGHATLESVFEIYEINGASGEVNRIPDIWNNFSVEAKIHGWFNVYKKDFYIQINNNEVNDSIYKNNSLLKTLSSDYSSMGMTDLYYILGWRFDTSIYAFDIRNHLINTIGSITPWGILDSYEPFDGDEYALVNKHGISKKREDTNGDVYIDQFIFDGTQLSSILANYTLTRNSGNCGKDFWVVDERFDNFIVINHLGNKVANINLTDLVGDFDNYINKYIRIGIGFTEKYMYLIYDVSPDGLGNYFSTDLYIYSYTLIRGNSQEVTDLTIDQKLTSPLHQKQLYANLEVQGTIQLQPDRAVWYLT